MMGGDIMLLVYRGYARKRLREALKVRAIPELLQVIEFPYKEYYPGFATITFEFGVEEEGWRDNIRKQKFSNEVQAVVNLGLYIFEKNGGGSYQDAIKFLSQNLSFDPDFVKQLRYEIRLKLEKIMSVVGISEEYKPLPTPKLVPYEKVAEDFYSPEYVGNIFQLPPDTIIYWCRTGQIKAVKLGAKWRIPESEVLKLKQGHDVYEEQDQKQSE
jgi:hypothetical protein